MAVTGIRGVPVDHTSAANLGAGRWMSHESSHSPQRDSQCQRNCLEESKAMRPVRFRREL
jgi:hypothetical protein